MTTNTEQGAEAPYSGVRLPVLWAVESATTERVFAWLLWFMVPLQYYVLTNIGKGLSSDDLFPAVTLSLISIVFIFLLSSVAAWLAAFRRPRGVENVGSLTPQVRMWVVASLTCTAFSYFLLLIALIGGHIAVSRGKHLYGGDVISGFFNALILQCGYSPTVIPKLFYPMLGLTSFIYSFIALLLIVLLHAIVHAGSKRVTLDTICVGLISTLVMFATNCVATWD